VAIAGMVVTLPDATTLSPIHSMQHRSDQHTLPLWSAHSAKWRM